MPQYEYLCKDCRETFTKVLTLNEHEGEVPSCPHCGSKSVEQRFSAFFAVTSKKSA